MHMSLMPSRDWLNIFFGPSSLSVLDTKCSNSFTHLYKLYIILYKLKQHKLTVLSPFSISLCLLSIPFFFLLEASLRFCPSSSSVMVNSAGMAERLSPFLSFHLPHGHPPPPLPPPRARPLLSGIACPVAYPQARS